MHQSANQPINLDRLARLLKTQRKKHRLSLNRLARLSGLSRRTLARIESGRWSPVAGRGQRTAFKLAKALLGERETGRQLADATRLSHTFSSDPDPLLKLLDPLYDYPAFLFHDSPVHRLLREEYGSDYTHALPLLLRSGFGTRNLGARLRAFRMQHDLTLVETADLLGLSKSELHRLERAERHPSPKTRFKLLRLLTLPLHSVHLRSSAVPIQRERWLRAAKALLSLPPPQPIELQDDPNSLHRLRYFWLASALSTKQLAAQLDISQPHLIRLLRGDRKPSRKLRERIQALSSLRTGH